MGFKNGQTKNKFRGKMSHEMLCPKCHRPMIIVENHILTPLGDIGVIFECVFTDCKFTELVGALEVPEDENNDANAK
jgi:hypothetical protein